MGAEKTAYLADDNWRFDLLGDDGDWFWRGWAGAIHQLIRSAPGLSSLRLSNWESPNLRVIAVRGIAGRCSRLSCGCPDFSGGARGELLYQFGNAFGRLGTSRGPVFVAISRHPKRHIVLNRDGIKKSESLDEPAIPLVAAIGHYDVIERTCFCAAT